LPVLRLGGDVDAIVKQYDELAAAAAGNHAPFLRFYLHLRTVCALLLRKKADCFRNLLFSTKSAVGGRNPPAVDEIASR